MKNKIEKFNFNKNEIRILIILSFVFVCLLSFSLFNKTYSINSSYNYAKIDSLYYSKISRINNNKEFEHKRNLSLHKEKNVDNDQELLDLRNRNIKNNTNSNVKSTVTKININKAGINLLKSLPGIGEKTAKKIIEFRKQFGNFNKIEEIKKVNGIGNKKFQKLKMYIIIK